MTSSVSRNDLITTLQDVIDNDSQLSFLDKRSEQQLTGLFADSFMSDPLMLWLTGLNTSGAGGIIDKAKRQLVLKSNKTMMGWSNRPILSRKKGVVLGLETNDGTLAGAISLVPSYSDHESVMDIISNIIKVGIPPTISGKTKKKYGPMSKERLETLSVLPKKRKEIMKHINGCTKYVYIQTLGVSTSYQGKGYGGKLLRTILDVVDNPASSLSNVPLYLETESEENESLYKHFGFHTVETIDLYAKGDKSSDSTQRMYLMVRYSPR